VRVYRGAGAVRDLRFSRDGGWLAWFDGTAVMLAAVKGLALEEPRSLPVPLAIEALDDFSADGKELIVTASGAIYSCALKQPRCRELAREQGQRLDWARLTPSGKRLLFASTSGGWFARDPLDYKTDYWLMDLASGHASRMTWFNEVQNPHYIDHGARVTYSSWTPDGLWLLATVVEDARKNRVRLLMIQFPEPE
jgi:hypothetical protein